MSPSFGSLSFSFPLVEDREISHFIPLVDSSDDDTEEYVDLLPQANEKQFFLGLKNGVSSRHPHFDFSNGAADDGKSPSVLLPVRQQGESQPPCEPSIEGAMSKLKVATAAAAEFDFSMFQSELVPLQEGKHFVLGVTAQTVAFDSREEEEHPELAPIHNGKEFKFGLVHQQTACV